MSPRTVAIIAALDTKGAEAQFVEEIVRKRGHRTLMIDVGVMVDVERIAEVSSRQVAQAGGVELDEIRRASDKARAMEVMTRGAATVAARLYSEQKFDAMIGI